MSDATEQFFAICPRGLEPLLADELRALGGQQLAPEGGGVGFAGPMATAYTANLHSRIASRVLWQLAGGEYRDEGDLYAQARAVAWERHFDAEQTLRVDLSASRSPLRSLEFATLKTSQKFKIATRDWSGRSGPARSAPVDPRRSPTDRRSARGGLAAGRGSRGGGAPRASV